MAESPHKAAVTVASQHVDHAASVLRHSKLDRPEVQVAAAVETRASGFLIACSPHAIVTCSCGRQAVPRLP